MVELGTVLETIHRSRRRLGTVRGVVRVAAEQWRIWSKRPGQVRVEQAGGETIFLRAGERWWYWDREKGAAVERDARTAAGGLPLEHLLDPTPLLAAQVEVLGEGEVAGRPAISIRARPRPGSFKYPPAFRGWWLDGPIEVAIDLEVGIALGAGNAEFLEVAFDEDLADELFAPSFPRGKRHRRPNGRRPARERELPLEEALRLAPFPVVLPTLLPEGARLSRCTLVGDGDQRRLTLFFVVDPGPRYSLLLKQGPTLEPPVPSAEEGWEATRVGGTEFWIREWQGRRLVQLVVYRDDGAVFMQSDLPRDAIVAMVLSLMPADE